MVVKIYFLLNQNLFSIIIIILTFIHLNLSFSFYIIDRKEHERYEKIHHIFTNLFNCGQN
jgi:formate hydrogenlyase subunit 3/multisubunit Na+/H+ antiporter MnhD subunit